MVSQTSSSLRFWAIEGTPDWVEGFFFKRHSVVQKKIVEGNLKLSPLALSVTSEVGSEVIFNDLSCLALSGKITASNWNKLIWMIHRIVQWTFLASWLTYSEHMRWWSSRAIRFKIKRPNGFGLRDACKNGRGMQKQSLPVRPVLKDGTIRCDRYLIRTR